MSPWPHGCPGVRQGGNEGLSLALRHRAMPLVSLRCPVTEAGESSPAMSTATVVPPRPGRDPAGVTGVIVGAGF